MKTLVLLALIQYLSAQDHVLECQAVVICEPGEQSCHAHPIESCADFTLAACLESELCLSDKPGHAHVETLGCAVDLRELDVDREAVLRGAP